MKKNLLFSMGVHLCLISVPLFGISNSRYISVADTGSKFQIKLIKATSKHSRTKNAVLTATKSPQMAKRKALHHGTENNTGQTKSENQKLYHPAPQYPHLAKVKGWQGKVLIKVWTDKNGQIVKRKLLQSSGFNVLDQAAFETLQHWKTMANLQNETVPFVFKLTSTI